VDATRRDSPSTTAITPLGHRAAVTDATGTLTYDYDALYRPLDVAAPTGDVTYSYDALGSAPTSSTPPGRRSTYTHDAAGRLTQVLDWSGGTTVYTYTAAGRLSEMQLPNGIRSMYAYDDAGRLVEIVHQNVIGDLLARYFYTLDAVGNRVGVMEELAQPGVTPHGPGDVQVTVQDTAGTPEAGLRVYVFSEGAYTGRNGVTDAGGQVTFTQLPEGAYRFRADKNGTQFWSGAPDHCAVPVCTAATVTTSIPVVVAVADTAGTPESGLRVYAFDGTTYTGYNKTTDANGWATFTLPLGNYRFRADKNGTQFWSAPENHCAIPGCTGAAVTTTIPVVVAVQDTNGTPESGLRVYAFDGTTYTGYNKTTDANGYVTFTLPLGNYRFRADKNGTQFWSAPENHCAIPGCTGAAVTTTIPVIVTVSDAASTPEAGLRVYAFDGATYTGYNQTTDASGWATFTLPLGNYRFRADKADAGASGGTQFWSAPENHCFVPGCTALAISTSLQTVVTVRDSNGAPEAGLRVYAFDGATYTGYNRTTDASGYVTFTLPFGAYRFRADKDGTQFWSAPENHCQVPGCVAVTVATTPPTRVSVQDTNGTPESGLRVYAFDGTTYTGYNRTTDASGYVTFTLPLGNYRFRADKNGTQFWSGPENHCDIPGCTGAAVTTTIPVVVAVQDTNGTPESGLRVYAFDGTTYTGYNKTTDASGWATFTLPFGDYRFRADKDGAHYWSHTENHCTLPGCTSATLTTTIPTGGLPWGGGKALAAAFTSPHLVVAPAPQAQSTTLVERTIDYTYDPLNRLTAAAYSTPSAGSGQAGESYAYQYDAVGNRTAYTLTTPLDGTAVTTYTYDAANRLLVAGAPGHSVAYTWDARGNLLADGTFTYTYNAAGRMVRAESLTATLVYTYNADGLRVARSQSVASVESVDTFTWDWATPSTGSGQAPVPELLSDGDSLYLIGYDTLGWQRGDGLAPSEAEGWTFVLPDALGRCGRSLS
jgi:YD repeat-containing protein